MRTSHNTHTHILMYTHTHAYMHTDILAHRWIYSHTLHVHKLHSHTHTYKRKRWESSRIPLLPCTKECEVGSFFHEGHWRAERGGLGLSFPEASCFRRRKDVLFRAKSTPGAHTPALLAAPVGTASCRTKGAMLPSTLFLPESYV